MKELANQARTYICVLIEKKRELKTFAVDHYETAKHETATTLVNKVYPMATRIGDLKTREQETRYKEVETSIRIHNINSLGKGTPTHFRNISNTAQIKTLMDILYKYTGETQYQSS